jgi:2-iminoacetate synthase
MGFIEELRGLDLEGLQAAIHGAGDREVSMALARPGAQDARGIAALLSPAASARLPELAASSAHLTRQRFGRVIQLYAPLYISNHCINACAYCGFARGLDVPRASLDQGQALAQAALLRGMGFRHLLLVAGEDPLRVTPKALASLARALAPDFASINIETAPFSLGGYRELASAGVDGMALYQETYLESEYPRFHPSGPKRDFARRLQAIEDAGQAGFRSLGVAALLGLGPWRLEVLLLALHARFLRRRFWKSRVAVSFPRIRTAAGAFTPPNPVPDAALAQMQCALRLALPDAELVLSTREPAALRDALMTCGATRLSAGSSTRPGGYGPQGESEAEGQFEVQDSRSPQEVAAAIRSRGLEPVWKDFDRALAGA